MVKFMDSWLYGCVDFQFKKKSLFYILLGPNKTRVFAHKTHEI